MPKYQLSIGGIIRGILVPLAITHAAYNDVTMTTDTVLTVGGYTLTVSGSSALVQSIEVGSSDFSVVVATGSSMTVSSTDRKSFTVEGVTSAYVTKTCTDSVSTVAITVPSGSEATPTALITPTSTTCTSTTAGNTVSSGSGGGGGAPPAPVTTPVIIPAVSVVPAVPGCPAELICTPIVGSPSTVATLNLSKDLSRGSEGADVKKLQEFLAQDKAIYPEGIANGFFGPATERAVKRLQAKYGIPQVGRVGPMTREKIREITTSVNAAPATAPVQSVATPAVSVVITKVLTKGSKNSEVKSLQIILNKDTDTQVSATGDGSPGNETDYFGSLTLRAVEKFQEKYEIALPGDSGYGIVGPKTRAKLNELGK